VDTLYINIERLCGRLDELAQVGAIDGTMGCSRLALTDEDAEGRRLVITWMRDLGMDIAIDGIGNVIGTWYGSKTDQTLPSVMTGSHIDTVRTGGRFDGNLGVLAGLEVVETIAERGLSPAHPISVGFFTGEEGSRYAPDMLGSLVYVGGLGLESALHIEGIDGTKVGKELERIDFRGQAPCPGPVPKAFLELHIEQGPVLEAENISIGAVDSVQGISWTQITIEGQSNHAGTTPMQMRHDAGWVAGEVTSFVRRLANEIGGNQVGTVGKIDLVPNLVNVVASRATLTADLRNTDDERLKEAELRLANFCDDLSEQEDVRITSEILARFEPVKFDDSLVREVIKFSKSLKLSVKSMTSGAGHDAQMFARICPTAMIFVPSKNGLSHNPDEFTSQEEIENGSNVLLQMMIQLAGLNHG
jgi:N-carbamoyl-L-amino-acid hydrolase|tara:strand:+ start:58882 stop:60132 length:1251 start_codon:yes stop_codon:yes gene_type:complete